MAIIDGCGLEITTIGFSVANRGKESIGWRVLPRHVWIRLIRMLRSDNADVSKCAFKSMIFKVKDSSYIVITKKTAHKQFAWYRLHAYSLVFVLFVTSKGPH